MSWKTKLLGPAGDQVPTTSILTSIFFALSGVAGVGLVVYMVTHPR